MNHYYNGHDESTNYEIDENDNNGAVIISELRGGGATSPRSLNSGLSSNVCPFFRAAVIFCDCLGILAIICATHRVYLILIGREKKVTVVEDRIKLEHNRQIVGGHLVYVTLAGHARQVTGKVAQRRVVRLG